MLLMVVLVVLLVLALGGGGWGIPTTVLELVARCHYSGDWHHPASDRPDTFHLERGRRGLVLWRRIGKSAAGSETIA